MTEYDLSKSLLEKKGVGVPMLTYLRNGIWLLMYRLAIIVGCVYLHDEVGTAWQNIFVLIVGGLLGATLQEMYLHYKGQKTWPLLSTLYDWHKIEDIVNEQTKEDAAK